jgi:hypothetical protein
LVASAIFAFGFEEEGSKLDAYGEEELGDGVVDAFL